MNHPSAMPARKSVHVTYREKQLARLADGPDVFALFLVQRGAEKQLCHTNNARERCPASMHVSGGGQQSIIKESSGFRHHARTRAAA
jgi:hypothetical protein